MHVLHAHEFCATLLYSEDNSVQDAAIEVPSQMHRKNAIYSIMLPTRHASTAIGNCSTRTCMIICMSTESCAIYTLVTNRV